MKIYKVLALVVLSIILVSCEKKTSFISGNWKLDYNEIEKTINITRDSSLVFNGLYPSYKWGDRIISSKE